MNIYASYFFPLILVPHSSFSSPSNPGQVVPPGRVPRSPMQPLVQQYPVELGLPRSLWHLRALSELGYVPSVKRLQKMMERSTMFNG